MIFNPLAFFQKKNNEVKVKELQSGYGFSSDYPIEADRKIKEIFKSYRDNETIHASVSLIGNAFAKQEIILMTKKNGEWEETKDHELLKLIQNPNPWFNFYQMMRIYAIQATLVGEVFWHFDKPAKKIYPIQQDGKMKPIADPYGYIKNYQHDLADKGTQTFEIEEIIHFQTKLDPEDFYKNTPATKSIGLLYDMDKEARIWNGSFFKNHGMPSFLLFAKGRIQDFKSFCKSFSNKFRGVKNAHKTLMSDVELGKIDMSISQKDMEFYTLLQHVDKQIMKAFNIPKSLLGDVDGVNLANAETNKTIFNEVVIKPLLSDFVSVLNLQLVPQFGDNIKFDFIDPNPESEEEKNKRSEFFLRNGIKTTNEVRADYGLDPVDGGDVLLFPSSVTTMDNIENPFGGFGNPKDPEKDPKDPKDPEDKPKKGKPKKSYKQIEEQWNKRFDKNESLFARSVFGYLEDQKNRVIKEITGKKTNQKGILEDILGLKLNDKKLLTALVAKIAGKILVDEAENALVDIGIETGFRFDRASKEIEKQAKETGFNVTDTTYKAMTATMKDGIDLGEGVDKLTKRIQKVFDVNKKRATLIARTETVRAGNTGIQLAFEIGGVKKKQWLTSVDGNERDSHGEANGQSVGIKEPFLVGGKAMQRPGDPAGGVAEIANCRCRIIPLIQ